MSATADVYTRDEETGQIQTADDEDVEAIVEEYIQENGNFLARFLLT